MFLNKVINLFYTNSFAKLFYVFFVNIQNWIVQNKSPSSY